MFRFFSCFMALTVLCSVVSGQQIEKKSAVFEAVNPLVERGQVPGIVSVIADRNKVLQMDCMGFADRENQVPLTGESVFWVASQSKAVCAVAVMTLVEQDKLSLSDPVEKFLPELAQLRVKTTTDSGDILLVKTDKPITIRHILSHTSGMEWVTPLQQKFGIDVISLQQMVTACAMTPLKSQPSSEYSYSNMGVEIAAAIIERITGKSYPDYLQERIFTPLKMTDTTFWPSDEQIKRMALVYSWNASQNQLIPQPTPQLTYPLTNRQTRYPAAAGGLFSTPNDLVKFWQMLLNEGSFNGVRIISPESVRAIGSKQTGDSVQNNYGLCVGVNGNGFGHGGACGTDSQVSITDDRVYMYFIQESGVPKAGEAKNAFNNAVREFNRTVSE